MSKTYLTADPHFGHSNIIKYCDRPFKDSKHMDKVLIDNHNKIVSPDDFVYYIGDFCFSKQPEVIQNYLKRLNGTKILILGNHDYMSWQNYLYAGFQSVHSSLELIFKNNEKVILFHDPSMVTCVPKGVRSLVGHVHKLFTTLDNNLVLNVGVDVHNFFPISEDEILEKYPLL